MRAYAEATRTDKQVGGALAKMLEANTASVAPAAAEADFNAKRYPDARKDADIATRLGKGSDPRVTRVRAGLEDAARATFSAGQEAQRAGNLQKARTLWRSVLQMVPNDNAFYNKANDSLNTAPP